MFKINIKKRVRGEYNFDRLKNFPNSFLSITLGLIGFTLAWQKAEHIFELSFSLSSYLFYFSIALSFLIIFIYILKIFKYPAEVKKEFNHPIKINFYPILAKLFLISSIIYLSTNIVISKYVWWIGVLIQFIFTLIIISTWISHDKFKIEHINPSWFIPVVGCIIIPIAGVQHFSLELSWFFFSIGLFWWLILTVLVMNRIIFHHPLPDKLMPTLFILFAPPIIGFISLVKLMGEINPFAKILYYFGAFLFILMLCQYRLFIKIKFYLSWWAYSFPLATMTIGTFLMYSETNLYFFKIMSWILFVFLNLVLGFLIYKTIKAIIDKKICIEEEE